MREKKMNAKKLIAAVVVFAAAGSVFAQQTEFVAPDANFVSTKTRAEVLAELEQAQANGTYVVGGTDMPEFVPVLAKTIPASSGTRYAGNKNSANNVRTN
jgi:hypothetical protein